MRDKIFYVICFGFIFGVLFRSFVLINIYMIILLMVISFGIITFYKLNQKQKSNWGILIGIFILFLSLGMMRFHLAEKSLSSDLEMKVGQSFELSGVIIDEPSQRENNQSLIVAVDKDVNILLNVNFDEDYKYGDGIAFYGKLKKPENFITDQGKEFDYVNYLRKDDIFYVVNYPKVEIISHDNGNKIKSILFSLKNKFLEKIDGSIESPENLLMGGLILGEKSAFDKELKQNFITTGTIHIVALSGYNVTIVAEWIMKLFKSLPMNFGIGIGIFSIILFVLMTGANSTAIRAGIMAVLALVARATGRNYDVARALILAGIIMILINPFVLAFDVSFQLSFIATIAVIFVAPKMEKYFTWVTKTFELRDIITVTFSAYVFVLPFILYKMGTLSLVALPTNALILPFIPFTMLLGFITGFVGLIWYIFAIPFGFLSFIFLHYELFVINLFAKLPFSMISIPNFPFALMLAIYVYFIYRLFGRNIKKFFIDR